MKIVIDIDDNYYEIMKHDVDNGMDYLPCVLIAKGTPLQKLNKHDIDVICEYIKEKANKKELHNRNGVCDMEVIGFVHGLRWTVSYLKSLKG